MPHATRAAELVRQHALTADDLVIEVGSGDGSFLRAVGRLGVRVLGVEPDPFAAARALRSGVDTIYGDLTPPTARTVRRRYGPARVVIAADPAAAAACLGPGGVVIVRERPVAPRLAA